MKPLFERYNQAAFYIFPLVSITRPDEYPDFKDCEYIKGQLHFFWNSISDVDILDIPEEFKEDVQLIIESRHKETSKAYQDKIYKMFPELKKGLDRRFGKESFLDFKVTNNLSNDLEMPEL